MVVGARKSKGSRKHQLGGEGGRRDKKPPRGHSQAHPAVPRAGGYTQLVLNKCVDHRLSFLGSKSWDEQFILIKPQAGPHAEMQLLKSFDERGREEKREEEELRGRGLSIIMSTGFPPLDIQEQAQGLRRVSRQEPWKRKED